MCVHRSCAWHVRCGWQMPLDITQVFLPLPVTFILDTFSCSFVLMFHCVRFSSSGFLHIGCILWLRDVSRCFLFHIGHTPRVAGDIFQCLSLGGLVKSRLPMKVPLRVPRAKLQLVSYRAEPYASSTRVNDMNEYCFAILYKLKINDFDTFFIRSLKQVMMQRLTIVIQRLIVVTQRLSHYLLPQY